MAEALADAVRLSEKLMHVPLVCKPVEESSPHCLIANNGSPVAPLERVVAEPTVEKVEGENWLLYSVVIQPAERAVVETRTSSIVA
jgi:hypothetical protein